MVVLAVTPKLLRPGGAACDTQALTLLPLLPDLEATCNPCCPCLTHIEALPVALHGCIEALLVRLALLHLVHLWSAKSVVLSGPAQRVHFVHLCAAKHTTTSSLRHMSPCSEAKPAVTQCMSASGHMRTLRRVTHPLAMACIFCAAACKQRPETASRMRSGNVHGKQGCTHASVTFFLKYSLLAFQPR